MLQFKTTVFCKINKHFKILYKCTFVNNYYKKHWWYNFQCILPYTIRPCKRVDKKHHSILFFIHSCYLTSSLPLPLSVWQHKSPFILLSSFFSGFFHIRPVGFWWITEMKRRLIFCVRQLWSMVAPYLPLFRYQKSGPFHSLCSLFCLFVVTPLAQSSNPINSLIALLASPWQHHPPPWATKGPLFLVFKKW